MNRHSGRRGKIRAQIGGLTLIMDELLTASVGNQNYTSAHAYWDRSDPYYPLIEPEGVKSGGGVTPHVTVSDAVSVAGGVASIAGGDVTFIAGALSGLTRPASSANVVITNITVNASGTLVATAGSEGTSGGARGAVGGPPYVAVGEVLLATVQLSDTASALVTAPEVDNAAKEWTEIPGWQIDFHDGEVNFDAALPSIHTAAVPKRVYSSYKYITLQDVGHLSEWSLSITTDQVDTSAFNDLWKQSVPGQKGWSGSFAGYHVNSYWFDKAVSADSYWYLEFYDDRNTSNRLAGFVSIDWDISCAKDTFVGETMAFQGNDELKRLAS